jgi:DNA-binding MarR family transcriptional regulator
MCYAYLVPQSRYDQLDDLLTRIHVARQRPQWRVLGAVQRHGQSGGASVRDVAELLAVDHSTASRTVAAAVAAGLLTKTSATDDQRRCALVLTDAGRAELAAVTGRRRDLVAKTVADWPDSDVDTLVTLLDRLTDRFETVAAR